MGTSLLFLSMSEGLHNIEYLESARIGFFETLAGWDGRTEGGGRQGPVVVSQAFNYRRQVHYPEEPLCGA